MSIEKDRKKHHKVQCTGRKQVAKELWLSNEVHKEEHAVGLRGGGGVGVSWSLLGGVWEDWAWRGRAESSPNGALEGSYYLSAQMMETRNLGEGH